MRPRLRLAGFAGRIDLVTDDWQGVAPAVLCCGTECQAAVAIGMHIKVAPNASSAAGGPRVPVLEERISEQERAVRATQSRRPAAPAFPDAKIVTHVRRAGRASEVLPRNQAVLLVHAWIDFQVGIDRR